MADVEIRTIAFGSALEETPEGFYRQERIRRAHERRLAQMQPWEREIYETIERQIDALMFGYSFEPVES